MISLLADFMDDTSGSTAIEYALICGALLVCTIASLGLLKGSLTSKLEGLAVNLNTAQ